MNPIVDLQKESESPYKPPEGYTRVYAGITQSGDLVLTRSGWKTPNKLGINVKILIVARRIKNE